YQPSSSDKIMKLEDPDEKYKRIDDYSQDKAKKWLEDYVNGLNGVTPQMITARGPEYKRAYKEAIKEGRVMLSKKIGNTYEVLQGDWVNYEYFINDDPVSKIWENLVKYIETTKRKELNIEKAVHTEIIVDETIINSICSNLANHINDIRKIAIKYNPFFHKLVYHLRYKEHIKIPNKIGAFETMQKNEIIIERPTLPYISEAERLILESFRSTWDESVNILYTSYEMKI
ncbi:6670_t:CDS:1, partial [Entrophospora sp. SA101]